VTLFPHNRDRETHQAVICVFDPDNGTPRRVDGRTFITATRTAAGSALATRLLARDDARVLALIGTGVQARSHRAARFGASERIRRDPRCRARSRKAEALALSSANPRAPCRRTRRRFAAPMCVARDDARREPVVRREWLDAGNTT
jgi:ornithine cyclodeaminase